MAAAVAVVTTTSAGMDTAQAATRYQPLEVVAEATHQAEMVARLPLR